MNNYSNNVFKYNNKQYSLFISLYTGNGDDDSLTVSLDCADIEEFVYENKLNSLVLTGHIIYTDKYARVDKFFNQHFGYCNVLFCENTIKQDNDIAVEKMDDTYRFEHLFMITGIKAISRQQSIIKYQIDLVSNNWFKCIANIDYTNYNIGKEPVFDILKACMKNNDLVVDDEFFDKVKTNVKINYISNTNDNLFTASRYLMKKLYYYSEKDTAVKFFLYNESNDKYQLFDITNKDTATGTYSTVLSFFKTNNEQLVQQEPVNIGSLKFSLHKPEVYRSFFKYNMYDFSYDENVFENKAVEPDTTVNFANERINIDEYEQRYTTLFNSQRTYRNEGSYWNNNQDLYDDTVKILEENNTFILNIVGEILRKPGSLLTITIDRTMKNISSENKKELEERKRKYKTFEGLWMVSKVQHIICPAAQSYRQQLIIFRNFIPKIDTASTVKS